jgi:hypothetical protein
MGVKICPICNEQTESGEILLDRRLKPSMEKYTPTGYGICEKHQKLVDEGWVFLLAVKEDDKDYLLGTTAQIKKKVWKQMCPDAPDQPVMRVSESFMKKLQEATNEVS